MIQRHTLSFKHAFHGIVWAFKTQPNYKIHFLLSVIMLAGSIYFRISYYEFLLLLLLVVIGLTIETVNTAIEQTTDAIDEKWREDIKFAKDLAAGAMLIFSAGAFIIACIIFIPRIVTLINFR
ncbi:diacylglycerol kinase family protein [Candidatus Roizmanbacteria bacterium]|nr:diacylglycerol kinase family protein [Candidatus Roizmanbacteria bacterium]